MEILKLVDVRKYFGGVRALENVTTTLNEGELIMVIGPNGAGKTTLVNVISGLILPDGGKIIYSGEEITRYPPLKRIEKGIVRSFQLVNVFEGLTVYENLMTALFSRMKNYNRMHKLVDDYVEVSNEAENLLKLFGLIDLADKNIKSISYGDRKLLDIAISFAMNPKLIMLDEPTSGVATKDKDEIMEKIIEIIRKTKVTSIIIEHDMDVVFRYGERIIAMHQGKIIADGKADEVKRDEEVKRVLLGGIYA